MIRYDLAIVGGGLSGLSLAIQVAKAGYRVVLFEKEIYPFHRVCGEYISMESWDFLERIGLDLEELNVSFIKRVLVSDAIGNSFEQALPLGGFGVSRYKLDFELYQLAKASGADICDGTRVNHIQFADEQFEITSSIGNFKARMTAGCFGKRSNIDIKWKRPFTNAKANRLNNWVAVKYHVQCDFPCDLIALHNFPNGYCGLSKVEGDKYCLCYLTNSENLKKSNNSIELMEQTILSVNRQLKEVFSQVKKLNGPVAISQVSFDRKNCIENHAMMIGDAAGMIAPLCGNGMSMALHGSKIAASEIIKFLSGSTNRKQMELNYTKDWRNLFSTRLQIGRLLQRMLDYPALAGVVISVGRKFPWIMSALIRATHGQSF